MYVNVGTITSSSIPISSVNNAMCNATVPLATAIEFFIPVNSENFFSNWSINSSLKCFCSISINKGGEGNGARN